MVGGSLSRPLSTLLRIWEGEADYWLQWTERRLDGRGSTNPPQQLPSHNPTNHSTTNTKADTSRQHNLHLQRPISQQTTPISYFWHNPQIPRHNPTSPINHWPQHQFAPSATQWVVLTNCQPHLVHVLVKPSATESLLPDDAADDGDYNIHD